MTSTAAHKVKYNKIATNKTNLDQFAKHLSSNSVFITLDSSFQQKWEIKNENKKVLHNNFNKAK